MKAKLSFNLPEEAQEHRDALQGTDWKLVSWRMQQALLGSLDGGVKTLKTAVVLNTLNDIIEELGLNLDQ